jgi:hypothetical protein
MSSSWSTLELFRGSELTMRVKDGSEFMVGELRLSLNLLVRLLLPGLTLPRVMFILLFKRLPYVTLTLSGILASVPLTKLGQ